MRKIYAVNNHPTDTYTVTTIAATQYDLFPNGGAGDMTINPESYEATVTQLSGFSGVVWYPYEPVVPRAEGILSPSSISGQTDDWAPSGWSTGPYDTILVAATGLTPSLTGLVGGRHGRIARLINVGGTALTIAHQNGSSASANRFAVTGLVNLPMAVDESIAFMYLAGGVNRWRHAA